MSNINFDYGFIELLETKSGKSRKIPISDKIIISLHIHSQKITPEQLNCIVAFTSRFNRENYRKIEIISINCLYV